MLNAVICVVAPTLVTFRAGDGHGVWTPVYWMAVASLMLTPLQLAFLWLVLRDGLAASLVRRRARRDLHGIFSGRDAIGVAFQPIVGLDDGRTVGMEALARFPPKSDKTPDVWFAEAHAIGCGVELEIRAVRAALEAAVGLAGTCYVAVNVSPRALQDPRLLDTVLATGVPPTRVVVEVTEHDEITDYVLTAEAVARIRQWGVRFGVDDAGSGYSSMRHIVSLAPDIIKVDRSLVAGIDGDPARRAMVASLVAFAKELSATVVAEGIESAAELRTLAELGVDDVQGYWLQRPSQSPADWHEWTRPRGGALGAELLGHPYTTTAAAPLRA